MQVQVISFHCVLKNKFGQILGKSFNQDVLTADESPDAPLRGLTLGLQGLKRGEKRKIHVSASQAYGFYDLSQVHKVATDQFSRVPKIGETILFREGHGPSRVTDIKDGIVTLDSNHPLAGQDLIFEVEVVEARPATAEDIHDETENPNQIQYH